MTKGCISGGNYDGNFNNARNIKRERNQKQS